MCLLLFVCITKLQHSHFGLFMQILPIKKYIYINEREPRRDPTLCLWKRAHGCRIPESEPIF